MIASALPKETPPPGLIYPAPGSGVEGSEEGLSAGFIAFPEDPPLTGDATNSDTSTSTCAVMVVQFQKFVASHQDQPVVMNYFRMASQLSANWTNTVILPDYDRIDILLNAEPGDEKYAWSVFLHGCFSACGQ